MGERRLLAVAIAIALTGSLLTAAPAAALRVSGAFAAAAPQAAAADGPKRFWVKDKHRYTSPWYAGARRKMINYGCTAAPYYSPDPRCRKNRGFHHGLDLAMPCGTKLFAGLRGRVVRPDSAGAPGPAYGSNAFRIRNHKRGIDILIGHARRVYVEPGDRVRRGQLIARASDDGAPDGCHLHFEVRAIGGGLDSARKPHKALQLQR